MASHPDGLPRGASTSPNSSLRKLLQVGLGGYVLALGLLGLLSWSWLTSLQEAYFRAQQAAETHRRFTRLRNVVLLSESSQRGFLLTNDPGTLLAIEHQRAEGQRLLGELDSTVEKESLRQLLGELRPLIQAKLEEISQTLSHHQAGDIAAARAQVSAHSSRDLTDEISDRITALQEAELETVDAFSQRLTAVRRQVGLWLAGGWLALVAFTAWLARALRRSMTTPASAPSLPSGPQPELPPPELRVSGDTPAPAPPAQEDPALRQNVSAFKEHWTRYRPGRRNAKQERKRLRQLLEACQASVQRLGREDLLHHLAQLEEWLAWSAQKGKKPPQILQILAQIERSAPTLTPR